ncbi:hypothetical protein ACFX13_047315 [Malus domestica]|uniref:uncharacterized protein n=1 Tax=Malus domestica TaxID=3750 RepID=UPI003976E005
MMEKVGVERFSVMGKSYSGFVAYHLARIWLERVEKVVIANSGVNMRRGDHKALLKKAKLEKIEDLMLHSTAPQLNKLLSLAMARRLDIIPDLFLSDIIRISQNGKLFQLVTMAGAEAAGFDIQGIGEELPWIRNRRGAGRFLLTVTGKKAVLIWFMVLDVSALLICSPAHLVQVHTHRSELDPDPRPRRPWWSCRNLVATFPSYLRIMEKGLSEKS